MKNDVDGLEYPQPPCGATRHGEPGQVCALPANHAGVAHLYDSRRPDPVTLAERAAVVGWLREMVAAHGPWARLQIDAAATADAIERGAHLEKEKT